MDCDVRAAVKVQESLSPFHICDAQGSCIREWPGTKWSEPMKECGLLFGEKRLELEFIWLLATLLGMRSINIMFN